MNIKFLQSFILQKTQIDTYKDIENTDSLSFNLQRS